MLARRSVLSRDGRGDFVARVWAWGRIVIEEELPARRVEKAIMRYSPLLQPAFQGRSQHSKSVADAAQEIDR